MRRKFGKKLRLMLREHKTWLGGSMVARPLDVRGGDMSWMDFSGMDLRMANFSRTNCEGARFEGAKLQGCNFQGANMHRATLKNADLRFSVLSRAFFAFVALDGCDLQGADMTGADLAGVDWTGAKIGIDLESRYFMSKFNVTPEGDIIGWKRLREGKLAKLLIPAEARRSNGFTRRCRAEFATVLGIVDADGTPHDKGVSKRDANLVYQQGMPVRADGWDEEWKNECSHGINFFITREEAEMYG